MAGSGEQQGLFPEGFLKGIALSVYQNSGDTTSNWAHFAKKRGYFGQRKTAKAFEKSNDFWNMYENDIKLAKDMGATAFRFSFEWARFEPNEQGKIDEAAITRYSQILDCIKANGLEPMATLHHFTHPQWFEERGGFADDKNIPAFLDYCTMVFKHFGPRIRLWATFNEPTCFSFVGYIVGLWCPGERLKMTKCGVVLCNLMKAHCAAYRTLKQLPGGQEARIGLVHQHIVFMPRDNLPWVRALCKWMTYWFGTEAVLGFFTTGEFKWTTPFGGDPKLMYTDEGLKKGEKVCDWWGINYYSRPAVNWHFGMGAGKEKEPVTDISFRIYPRGLYDSVKDASVLGLPIYITETGLADKADKNRDYCVRTHYAALLKCLADGLDVRGCFWWTLMDNIEWHEGFHIKFGLYRWDAEWADKYASTNGRPPEGLQLRPGGRALRELYNSWPNSLAELKAYATKAWEGKDLSQVKEVAGVAGPGAAGAAAAAKGGVPAGATAVNITAVAGTAEDAPAPVPAKEDETTDVEKVALVEK